MLQIKAKMILILCAVAPLVSNNAQAETLRIAGIYPAGDPDIAGIKSITMSTFTGADGESLSAELESQLTGVILNNEQYFTVVDRGYGGADATVTGGVRLTTEMGRVNQTREFCVLENHKGKCVQFRKVSVVCERRTLVFNATIKMVKNSTKQLVYSSTKPGKRDIVECPDDAIDETNETAIDQMIKAAVSSARFDMAPTYREERVRLIEDDEGMEKDVAKSFKAAIKQTKKNEDKACESMRALRSVSQDHISVLYNIALCAEKQDRFSEAAGLYRQIQPMFPNKDFVIAGLNRISERQRAQREWDKRSQPSNKKARN